MSSQQIMNNTKNVCNLSSILMRNRALVLVNVIKNKKREEREKEYKKTKQKIMNNKFCIGFCENPLDCSCFINNSI